MKAKIIRGEELIENNYWDTRVTDVFESSEFKVAKVRKIWDDIKTWYDTESDVAYYVIDWEWKCVIDWEEFFLKKWDMVYYPRWTTYKHLAWLTLLAISNPPFDRAKRVYTES